MLFFRRTYLVTDMTACMYSSKVSHVNTELNWNLTSTIELFTFDNLQKYWRNGPLNLF